jgi:hypothetical protein
MIAISLANAKKNPVPAMVTEDAYIKQQRSQPVTMEICAPISIPVNQTRHALE